MSDSGGGGGGGGGDSGGGGGNPLSVKNIFVLSLFLVGIIAFLSVLHTNRRVSALVHNQRPYWVGEHFDPRARDLTKSL